MSDSQSSPSENNVDDELKLALLAAFGDEAMNLMDDDDNNEMHADAFSSIGSPTLASEFNEIVVDEDDGPLIRFVKELNRAIYIDGKSATPNGENRPEAQHSTSAAPRFVLFSVGDQHFGVPLNDVLEIARYPTVTELPRTPSWLRGVANLRGQILSVTDLRNLLRLSSERPAVGEKIVIVHSKTFAASTAIVVDRVIGIRSFSGERGTVPDQNNGIASIASGTAVINDSTAVLIDADQLFGCVELLAFAS